MAGWFPGPHKCGPYADLASWTAYIGMIATISMKNTIYASAYSSRP